MNNKKGRKYAVVLWQKVSQKQTDKQNDECRNSSYMFCNNFTVIYNVSNKKNISTKEQITEFSKVLKKSLKHNESMEMDELLFMV